MSTELQIAVRFTTQLPEQFRIPDTPLTVPGSSKRAALSKIVNHLLELDDPRPFDFLVQGTLLRKSLKEHFIDHEISVEGVVEVEYIPVVLPPQKKTTAVHDDWIRSVNCRVNGFLSASYDGTVKCWNEDLEPQWSLSAHSEPITCVTQLTRTTQRMFLTASQDQTAKAWILEDPNSTPKELAQLIGHTDSLCSIVSSPGNEFCCSVGWNEQMHIWPCGESLISASNDPTLTDNTKRRKKNSSGEEVKTVGPLGQFTGHQGCISDVIWPIENTLYSTGWDHTLRKWDFNTGSNMDTFTSSRVVHCLSSPSNGHPLIAFGSSDGVLRFWDSRQKTDRISMKLYRSHSNWISSVKWAPNSEVHLVTSSYDHTLRVWDIRGTVPLGSVHSHQDKVLTVDWASEYSVLSGGADGALQLHEIDITSTEH